MNRKINYIILFILVICFFAINRSNSIIFSEKKPNIEKNGNSDKESLDKRCSSYYEQVDKKKTKRKTVYLSFDDGPSFHTKEVIKLLKDEGIVGTFFFTELKNGNGRKNQISKNKKLLIEAFKNGNMIANHTLNHDYNILYKHWKNVDSEIMGNFKIINKIITKNFSNCKSLNHVFRFPGGSNNFNGTDQYRDSMIKYLSKNNVVWVDWQVFDFGMIHPEKTAHQNYESIKKSTEEYLKKGNSQIVMITHDFLSYEIPMLKEYIHFMKSKGFKFDIINNQTRTFKDFERH